MAGKLACLKHHGRRRLLLFFSPFLFLFPPFFLSLSFFSSRRCLPCLNVCIHDAGTWRKAAMVYATKLNPALTATQQQDIHDSLELTNLCESSFNLVPPAATSTSTATALGCAAEEEFVHCVSTAEELRHALAAIAESNQRASAAAAADGGDGDGAAAMNSHTVKMSPGVYRLNETIVLGVEHSNTVINAPAGGVTITGKL